jgi:hypothetical protein
MTTGIFVIPMTANVHICQLSSAKYLTSYPSVGKQVQKILLQIHLSERWQLYIFTEEDVILSIFCYIKCLDCYRGKYTYQQILIYFMSCCKLCSDAYWNFGSFRIIRLSLSPKKHLSHSRPRSLAPPAH